MDENMYGIQLEDTEPFRYESAGEEVEREEEQFRLEDTETTEKGSQEDKEEESGMYRKAMPPEVIYGELQEYRLESRLGGGSQGSVHVYMGRNDGERYAVKLYDPKMVKEEALQKTLQVLKDKRLSNVTGVREYGSRRTQTGAECWCTVMDLYRALDSERFLWKNSDNPVYRERLVGFIEQMNRALSNIHGELIYHCDIKPANIMQDEKTGSYVLIDFGGAAKADQEGQSEKAWAITASYAPPETSNGSGSASPYVDYYEFGATLLHLINGEHPGHVEVITRRFQQVRKINYYWLPENVPDYYLNMLEGLLYVNPNEDERKSYRWTTEKLTEWLRYMKEGKLELAASCNKVPDERQVKREPKRSPYDFNTMITVDLNGTDYTMQSLPEMADCFLEHWDAGRDIMLNSVEVFSAVKSDMYVKIQKAAEAMAKEPDFRNGKTLNGEYFKFFYPFATDKKVFHWGDLPKVRNKEDIGVELHEMLEVLKDSNYNFGKWWDNIRKGKKGTEVAFAEIFLTGVLSEFLKTEEDEQLKKQCAKVEKLFQNNADNLRTPKKSIFSREELADMYLLARMLCNMTYYEPVEGKTVYENYEEFLEDIERIAFSPEKVEQMSEMMEKVQPNGGDAPDFIAWRKMQKGMA